MATTSNRLTTNPLRDAVRRLATALLLPALAGCGIGLSLGVGIGGDDDQPPSVSIAASVAVGAPGEVIQLVAAASDDFGVQSVAFYRIEDSGSTTLLSTDVQPPYQTATTLLASPTGQARYFARATDNAGQGSDSAQALITLR